MVERVALPPAVRLITRAALILVVMTAFGPVAGRMRMAPLLVLTILLAVALLFLGDGLARVVEGRLASATAGLAAALIAYFLFWAVGARLSTAGAILLGMAVGLVEYVQRRWESAGRWESAEGE